MSAPKPANELDRLAALRRYMLLDTVPEPEFDRITALAARLFDVPISLVSLVDADRQWFKSCIGISATETDRDVAFCAYALLDRDPLVVPDTLEDPRFADNPFVTGEPMVRFYAGAPLLTPEGFALGTLCLIDRRPRQLSRAEIEVLRGLAGVVVDLVEARLGYRAREMFERLAHLTPNVMYLFDLGSRRNVFGNRAMEELLGYPIDSAGSDVLGRSVHPGDLAGIDMHVARMRQLPDGEVVELTFRVRDASGAYRVFHARESVFERNPAGRPTKTLGIANDITELLRAQRTAHDKTTLLETVLRSAGEGIVAADTSGKVTLYNAAAEAILGLPVGTTEVGSRPRDYVVCELDGATEIPLADLPLARALRGEITEGREMMVRSRAMPSGRYVISTGRPLVGEDGAPTGGVVTFRDVTPLKRAQHALAELAVTDELTGIANKRALRERMTQLAREGARGRRFAVVVADIDHFKAVNDTHGHAIGDLVLAAFARKLKASVRATDFVARYGGEEFVVLYVDVDTPTAARLAEALRAAVATIAAPVAVTASFGVCVNGGELAGDAEGLIEAADQALYRAKREGRDRVVVFSAGERSA